MWYSDFLSVLNLIAALIIIYSLYILPKGENNKKTLIWLGSAFGVILVSSFFHPIIHNWAFILIALMIGGAGGFVFSKSVESGFHLNHYTLFQGVISLSIFLVTISALYSPETYHIGEYGKLFQLSLLELGLAGLIGSFLTACFATTLIRLNSWLNTDLLLFENQNFVNVILFFLLFLPLFWMIFGASTLAFWILILLSFAIGVILVTKVQKSDLELFIQVLNLLLGIGMTTLGFALNFTLLIITGALIATIGYYIAYRQCQHENRSLKAILVGDTNEIIFYDEDESDDDQLSSTASKTKQTKKGEE